MPRVDFHAHSNCSDGTLDPERLAAYLASRGARYAALTDHDTCAGSAVFRAALARRGVACVDGVEFTARSSFGELHILAYSAGPIRPELAALLPPQTGGRWGAGLAGSGGLTERETTANGHRPGYPAVPWAVDLIAGIRGCGAASYLAHPLTVSRDPATLGRLLDELAPAGLDGIEAIYEAYNEEERAMLLGLASSRGLAVSAGSDLHEPGSAGPRGVVEMDGGQWQAFRESIIGGTGPTARPESVQGTGAVEPEGKPRRSGPSHRRASGPARVAFPALAVITLFVVSMFAIVIPQVHGMLLEHKKETIQGIAESVVSILDEYERDVRAGRLDLESAQREATARIRDIRYGPLKKDYLWITDTLPRMVMHPYRPELDGQDLREFRDARGLPVFVEFVRATSVSGEGYVEYLWQWEDEEDNIVPKLSFVTRFPAWDWILGTGVYLDDVNAEISSLTNKIVLVATGVSAILAVLLAFMVQQGLAAEKARQSAESAVSESRERYRVLVEASREGMAIVMDGAFTFANSALLEMTGYSEHEFLLLSIDDVLIPFLDGTEESAGFLRSLVPDATLAEVLPRPFSCSLARKASTRLGAMVSATGFGLGGREGVMLAIREEGGYAVAKERNDDSRREAVAREAAAESAARRLAALEPVSGIAVSPAVCGPGSSMREAAAAMANQDAGVALVIDDAGRTLGSVSERELCRRVVAEGVDPQSPVFRVMDAPLLLIDGTASMAGARTTLMDSGSNWAAVESADGSVTKIVNRTGLERLLEDKLSATLARIGKATSVEDLADCRQSILEQVRTMDAAGAKAKHTVRLITEVHDLAVRKLAWLGRNRFGEAPCPWAFVALGSAGRGEMLPGSDQDNAIVFDPTSGDCATERQWFLGLGEFLCGSLERIGIPKCKHGLMARNPDWCAPRTEWEARYARWVEEPESERIVNLNALIDIRPVAGSAELVASIRGSFESAVARTPSFLVHLANGARKLRIPGAPVADPAGAKEAAGLFPAFARVYATGAGLRQTNTFDRLDALASAGTLWQDTTHESAESYEVLLKNRLAIGWEGIGKPGRIAEAMTKAALSQAALLQKRIGFDFPGLPG